MEVRHREVKGCSQGYPHRTVVEQGIKLRALVSPAATFASTVCESCKPKGNHNILRGSGKVELMTILDMEHEVSSIEILHHKEEIFLENKTR